MTRPIFPRDRQCDPVICQCCFCGGEIYQGERYYRISHYGEHLCHWCYDHAQEVGDDD